jgi:hypothetical protein
MDALLHLFSDHPTSVGGWWVKAGLASPRRYIFDFSESAFGFLVTIAKSRTASAAGEYPSLPARVIRLRSGKAIASACALSEALPNRAFYANS